MNLYRIVWPWDVTETSSRLGADQFLLSILGHEGSMEEIEKRRGPETVYSSRFLLLRIFSGDDSRSEYDSELELEMPAAAS